MMQSGLSATEHKYKELFKKVYAEEVNYKPNQRPMIPCQEIFQAEQGL
jgi:hypothetical protein